MPTKKRSERISWWDYPENQDSFPIPLSVGQDEGMWFATANNETEKLLGEVSGCGQGKTREEAILEMFMLIRMGNEYNDECRVNYQRFVPFRKGDWGHIGGSWFTVFGIHVYFRRGKGMKGGWYLPFTKLNISISSDWIAYRRWKRNREEERLKIH